MNIRAIKTISVAIILAFGIVAIGASCAQADDNGLVAFFKKLFKYPVKTTENVVHTTGHAVENTGGVAESAVRHTGEVATGQLEKTGELITEPVQKTGDMSYQLISETAGAPVKAAEEVQAEE